MRLILFLLLLSGMSGCVTETYVAGSEKPIVKTKASEEEAARARIALGLRYLQTGKASQAKLNFELAKKHAPKLGEVHYALAYYYQSVNELELAEKSYKSALRYAPHDGRTKNNYGAFLCQQGRYKEADKQFLAAINEPSYIRVSEAYENAAFCSLKAKKFDKAKAYSEKALSYNPNSSGALLTLAEASLERMDVISASSYLKRYFSRHKMDKDSAVLGYKLAYAQGSMVDQSRYAEFLRSHYPAAYADNVVRRVEQ